MKWKLVTTPLAVGLVLVAGVTSLMYMVSVVKTGEFSASESYIVYAIFDDVTGLAVKGGVTMVGTPVGMVDTIERVQTPQGVRARVGIRVQRDVPLYAGVRGEDGSLRGGASVTRRQLSILGDYYLTLSPGLFGDPLAEGQEIPIVVGSAGLDLLFDQADQAKDLYPRLDRIVTHVEELTQGLAIGLGGVDGGDRLKDIVVHLKELSGQLSRLSVDASTVGGQLRELVEDGTIRSIADNVRAATEDARTVAARVDKLVSTGDMEELVGNLAETSRQMSELGIQLQGIMQQGIAPRVAQLDRIFRNAEKFSLSLANLAEGGSLDVKEVLSNLRTFSRQLVEFGTRGTQEFGNAMATVQGTLATAQQGLGKLDETLDNVRGITTDLRQGKGSIGRLLTDDTLVLQVEEIIGDTRDFVKSYAAMQTELELSSGYFFETQSVRNAFSIRFRPSDEKYYLLQLVDDPRGYTRSERIVTQSSADGVTAERIERTTHSLKLSLQFARSWRFITGRFGVTENTGGLGLDLSFFNRRLQFQTDLFDFTMNTNPRLRAQVQWEFIRHVFVAGGGDDLVNPAYRDYFMSLGVRFTDKDFKALLLSAPSISP
jgi:phospholipid/cholesterol/gamma-HCH transport system substrate-binding protein